MKTVCCSKCERQYECANHAINNEGMNYAEDFYNFGSGSLSSGGLKDNFLCSERGDWGMFVPIKPKVTTINQELDLGSDEEIQKHIDESGYTGLMTPEQVRNIIREGLYKMFKDAIKT